MSDLMSDRRRAGLLAFALLGALLALAAPGVVAAADPAGGLHQAPRVVALVPGEQGGETPTGGGPDVGGIVVIAGVAIVVVAVLGGGFLLLRRRAGAPLDTPPAPAEGGEWWTCRNCGRNNLVGSARCYACGEWQR